MPQVTRRRSYICGKQFGSSSINIHQPQCLKKREQEQAQLEPALRTPVPAPPRVPMPGPEARPEDFQQYNDEAFQAFNGALAACQNCGRTFNPESLKPHLKSCKPKEAAGGPPLGGASGGAGGAGGSGAAGAAFEKRRGPSYLCGKQFGSSSIGIHTPQCLKKREKEQELLEPRLRTPAPAPPALPLPGPGPARRTSKVSRPGRHPPRAPSVFLPPAMTAAAAAYNDAAFQSYNGALVPCPNCGRTFNPGSLDPHLKSCKAKAPEGRGGAAGGLAGAPAPPRGRLAGLAAKAPKTVTCYVCGRGFGTSSIAIHTPQCIAKREKEQASLEYALKTALPDPPGARCRGRGGQEELEAYNAEAGRVFEGSLPRCPNCARSFNPPTASSSTSSPASPRKAPTPGAPPLFPRRRRRGRVLAEGLRGLAEEMALARWRAARAERGGSYLCGRSFGTSSIAIHMPQCAKKREAEQDKLEPHLRSPAPAPPAIALPHERTPAGDLKAYNEASLEIFNRSSLAACPNCRRTFQPDRLEVHLRSCKPKEAAGGPPLGGASGGAGGAGGSGAAGAAFEKAPRTIVCYLCGKQFGSSSIGIHTPQCLKKREKEQELLEPRLRTPAPAPPALPLPGPGARAEDFQAYNDAAFQSYNGALVPCPNCGRTFNPGSLDPHLKSCKAKAPEGAGAGAAGGLAGAPSAASGAPRRAWPPRRPRRSPATSAGAASAPARSPFTRPGACAPPPTPPRAPHAPRQCIAKREKEQASLEYALKTALPDPPGRPVPGAGAGQEELEAYNAEAGRVFEGSLPRCPNCARSFNPPDRLLVHLKSCKPKEGADSRVCGGCRAPLAPAAKFCGECGTKL
eukprot:tig00000692_g3249.t1